MIQPMMIITLKIILAGAPTWQTTRLAQACKKLFIFHHNPENNDKVLDAIQSKCSNINEGYIVAQEDMFLKLTVMCLKYG